MFRALLLSTLSCLVWVSCHNSSSLGDTENGSDTDTDSVTDTGTDGDSDTDSDTEEQGGCDPEVEYEFCDDFESYEAGDFIVQTAGYPWVTWSNPPLPDEDAQVSETQAFSGTKSLYIVDHNDVVASLMLEGGKHEIRLQVFVEDDRYGWFSFIQVATGGGYGVEVFFYPVNVAIFRTVFYSIPNQILDEQKFEFRHDEWIETIAIFDFDKLQASIEVGEFFKYSWPWEGDNSPPGHIDGIDFYGIPDESGSGFYVDDIKVIEL